MQNLLIFAIVSLVGRRSFRLGIFPLLDFKRQTDSVHIWCTIFYTIVYSSPLFYACLYENEFVTLYENNNQPKARPSISCSLC